jgi:hypothetical protein
MDEDQRRRANVERPSDDRAWDDARRVHGSLGCRLVGEKPVGGVEIENPQPLDGEVRHVEREVGKQGFRIPEHRARKGLAPEGVVHRFSNCVEVAGHVRLLPQHARLGGGTGREHPGKRAEGFDQPVGRARRCRSEWPEELDQDLSTPNRANRR